MKFLGQILNYIDIGAPLLTLFFFIKPFKNLPKELLYIFWFLVTQLVANVTASILELAKISNYTVYAANIILSFCILSSLFYTLSRPAIQKLIVVAAVLFMLCSVYSISNSDGISSYNSVVSAVASFIITAYCLTFFYSKLVTDTRVTGLTDGAFFWIIIGVFTYYTGSFFIFISYKFLIVQGDIAAGILWRFHNLLFAIFCFYTIYGLACKNHQKT